MSILVTCRHCHREFAPDRRAIVAGTWRLCESCRGGDPPPSGSGICPHCGRWLKSGAHRHGCPGRRRRGRAPPRTPVAKAQVVNGG
jgi:hypothetical protein